MTQLGSTDKVAGAGSVLDRSRIEQYRKMRPGFLERLVTAYLSESATYVASIRSGAASNDHETIRMTAHTLKSASINLGALRLGAICQQIETAAYTKDGDAIALLVPKIGVEYFDAEQALRGVLVEARPVSAA